MQARHMERIVAGALAAIATILATPALGFAGHAWSAETVATQIEQDAARTSFAKLEAFGAQALKMKGEAGLDRLNHVAWLLLNQSEFDKFAYWNGQMKARAEAMHNARYLSVAHINELRVRFDRGELAAGQQIIDEAGEITDWFARAHAKSTAAYVLIIRKEIGPALRLLYEADAEIPAGQPGSGVAHAAVWESLGLALMDLHDLKGAASAFGRQQFDFMPADYPRPDFDGIYNMTKLATELGQTDTAEKLAAAHHRLAVRSDLKGLNVWDAGLCASVAEARHDPKGVLRCLQPLGESLKDASFIEPQLLSARAVARARLGQAAGARRDWARLKLLKASKKWPDSKFLRMGEVEGETLLAEGATKPAYAALRAYADLQAHTDAASYSVGIGQLTDEMRKQLGDRAEQLATTRRNVELQRQVISSQHLIQWVGGAVILLILLLLGWQLRAAQALKAARASAEAASRAKSEFLANMSHEIRTPLNGVVAAADLLARDKLNKRQRELIDMIQTSGDTLQRLLSDILDLARIESGKMTIENTEFELGDTVRGVAALWRLRCDEKGVVLNVSVAPEWNAVVTGDVVRVRQVIGNFLSNAVKFTEQGAIDLTVATAPNGMVRIAVKDTGVGFEASQKALVLQRFQQADTSITRRFGGTGLGLSICCELARMMGGALDCEATPGEGASFWVDLPFTPCEAKQAAPAEQAAEAMERPLRILAADDHPTNRRILELMLSDQADLICVTNGQEALDALRAGPNFDIVLMDMQMPVMDGLTAVRAIRQREAAGRTPRMPVVMLTANAMAEHVADAHACGADVHLGKPFTAEALFQAIGEAMSQAELAAAA